MQRETLVLVRTIPLSGIEETIAHLAIDLAADRLLVAAPADGVVEVVDLQIDAVIRRVKGLVTSPSSIGTC